MALNLPDSWDEVEFIEDVSRRLELFDISNSLYSNNENRCYVFCQIGVNNNVDSKICFQKYINDNFIYFCFASIKF